ncbi:MAG: permease [Deltaproteobacteria bacterium]|nr:permease [Deltaproteobacteria bacterium]
MKTVSHQESKGVRPVTRMVLFPAAMLVIYGILFSVMPDRAFFALKSSGNIFLNMLVPLCLVFVLMILLNLFLKPAQIVKFLGKGAGIKGILLSAVAGIISTGPIYAWYPLLRSLREKGAGNSPIAIFLYNRAVKPFLLPVMVGYFGWIYVAILTILTVLGSIAIGYSLSALTREDDSDPAAKELGDTG